MVPNPTHIMQQLGVIAIILQTFGVIIGISLVMGSLFSLKKYAETRTYMSSQMSMAMPLTLLLSGALFLILPTTLATSLFAFFGDASPEKYQTTTSGIDQYIPVILMFVRLIGVGSIMRGIMLFSKLGHSSSSHGGLLGKALIHILGGLLCLHVLTTVNLIKQILDLV